MKVCPNINTAEWKVLEESVGKFEAYRDFMETKGEIRTPEQVQAKLDLRSKVEDSKRIPEQISMMDLANRQASEDLRPVGINVSQLKNSKAMEFASQISTALNVLIHLSGLFQRRMHSYLTTCIINLKKQLRGNRLL